MDALENWQNGIGEAAENMMKAAMGADVDQGDSYVFEFDDG